MKKISILIICALIIIGVTIFVGIKDAFKPLERSSITQAIYTIGDLNYEKSINANKKIVKLGPVFWGIYPGGLAFKNIYSAENCIKNNTELLNKFSKGWAIYQLSGDFEQDTYSKNNNYYINKSLFVVELVKKP
jgi:hypothetical protein